VQQQPTVTRIDPHNVMITFANGPIGVMTMGGAKLVTLTQLMPRAENAEPGAHVGVNAVVACRLLLPDQVADELVRLLGVKRGGITGTPAGTA
jgi:hypothetical protein